MKKILSFLVLMFVVSTVFVSCEESPTISFDETLLYGEWQSGTEHYKYLESGSGTTWDTSDDVTEDEAQSFTWILDASELTHIHILEIGGTVPKVYTVTELTATTLIYNDDFDVEFVFSKVSN